jgi:hypothetical protein
VANPYRAVRALAVVRLNRAFPCCPSLTPGLQVVENWNSANDKIYYGQRA